MLIYSWMMRHAAVWTEAPSVSQIGVSGVCSGEQGRAFGDAYHPRQSQSHACPESSMTSRRHPWMSLKQKGKCCSQMGNGKREKQQPSYQNLRSFHVFLCPLMCVCLKFSTLKHWGLIRYFLYFLLVFIYSRMHIIIITFPRSNRPWLLLS